MNLHSKKTITWTIVLILFLAVAIYFQFQWLSLLIPGAVLMWYGLLKESPTARIPLQKLNRTGLH